MYQPKLNKKRNGIPIMSNSEIDAHAEQFLKDYNSSVLKNPQPIDMEDFAEHYLNLALDYVYLSHCGFILGRMVFQDVERVPVYLPKERCADYLFARRGTLFIDNTLLNDWKEYRLRSTIGHECGHWLFHSDYYTNVDRGRYDSYKSQPELTGCKKTDIEGSEERTGRRKLLTDQDWLEHHTQYFSAAILMPKTPFLVAVSDLLENSLQDSTALAESLSEIFQVSPSSVNIRLSQLGLNEHIARVGGKQEIEPYQLFSQIPGTL